MVVNLIYSTYYFDTKYIHYFISKSKSGLYECKSNRLYKPFFQILTLLFEVKLWFNSMIEKSFSILFNFSK